MASRHQSFFVALRPLIVVVVLGASLFAGVWVSNEGRIQELSAIADAWQGVGGPLVGIDITEPRASIFMLAHDVGRGVRIIDHGQSRPAVLVGLYNFISRGRIRTVADALRLLNVPLTVRQARSLPLCTPLAELRSGSEIIVQSDPWQYGVASWYGPGFQGRLAASGEVYDMYEMTAAHRTLPMDSYVRVVSQRTGAAAVVRINDRGPYVAGRVIDLSYAAMSTLGYDGGIAAVYLERLDPYALDVFCE